MKLSTIIAFVLVCALPAISADREPVARELFNSSAPYTPGILAGDTLYVSGLQGSDPRSGVLPKDFREELRRCFDNVGLVLKAAKMDYGNVVSLQIYLTDMSQFASMNAVYREYFKDPLPARTALGVAALSLGARVEVAVIAKK
jgi:2-iminobutanoate/2-iminopropanoate deaminase